MPSPAGQFTEEQLAELRKAIKHQVKNLGVGSLVEQLVKELHVAVPGPIKPEQALQVLQERGVVENLASKLTAPAPLTLGAQAAASESAYLPAKAAPPATSDGRAYLRVKVLGGKAFTDYVARPALPGEQLQLSMELFGQRLDTAPVPASEEPAFAGEAFIELPRTKSPDGQPSSTPDPVQLLMLRQPAHFVVVASTPASVEGTGIAAPQDPAFQQLASHSSAHRAVHALGLGEWRTVLLRRKPVVVSVTLNSGPGAALGLPAGSSPAGVLQLQLSLLPGVPNTLDEPLLSLQQRTEAARDAQCTADFIQRAKSWWADYMRSNMEFKTRPVKVLARGEDGAQYPTPCFVQPLQLGRALSTPRSAARFVALLQRRDGLGTGAAALAGALAAGDGSSECWSSLHTILASRSASTEEMACLLASLLLGFGLDAFVVVGRLKNGAGHMWVMTRGAFATPTHWDPATGVRYTHLDPPSECPFLSVGCVFNHQHVYANKQVDDGVLSTSYLFEEPSAWHDLEVGPADKPGPGWAPLPLRPTPVDVLALEAHIESALKQVVSTHHKHVMSHTGSGSKCDMTWDPALEHLLMPALAAYEHEAVTGELAPGNDEFQAAIKRATPLGHIFKAVPQHHRAVDASVIAAALLADPQVIDLLGSTGPGSAQAPVFGLRAKVWAYPESCFSVWVMLAVRFKAA